MLTLHQDHIWRRIRMSSPDLGPPLRHPRPSRNRRIQVIVICRARRNIRLFKANFIKELSFLGQAEEDPRDLNTLQSKEHSAVRQAEVDSERIGVGITAEAQSIFDALSKTLPVCWDKTAIVVMNEVRVSSPYVSESITGGTPAANERVRKVLELERKRLQNRGAGQ